MRCHNDQTLRSGLLVQQPGQALIISALMLSVVLSLLLLGIDLLSRATARAEVDDALRHATRAAVQTFDYQALAENQPALADAEAVIAVARQMFVTNLGGVEQTTLDAVTLADQVQWTVLPQGGTCTLSTGEVLTFPAPAVCATVVVPLRRLLWTAPWIVRLDAVDTLDRSP